MKLTKTQLREIIREVIAENQLNATNANGFQKEFIKNFKGKNIQGWKVNFDVAKGGFHWTNQSKPYSVWATPFWDGKPIIPVDVVHNESGETRYEKTYPLVYSGNYEKDAASYLSAMQKIIKIVK